MAKASALFSTASSFETEQEAMVLSAHGSFQAMPRAGVSHRVGAPVSPRFRSPKSSLNSKPQLAACLGYPNLWLLRSADRRRPFARNERKLNRESPRGWGVPKSLEWSRSPDRRVSHAQIFFLTRGVLIQSNGIKQSKAESFQWPARCGRARNGYLFSVGGGTSKVCSMAIPDRWARRTHFFGHFRKDFFAAPARFRNLPRNSGWGGR